MYEGCCSVAAVVCGCGTQQVSSVGTNSSIPFICSCEHVAQSHAALPGSYIFADSRQAGGLAKRSSADEHVVERTPGTYPKGMVKSGPKAYGTSGFAPKASARPGSPCFAGKAKA